MEDIKLDFDDVLIVPKFSDIHSRNDVYLYEDIVGKWGTTIRGVPIIAANMDGVGTFSMNKSISRYGLFTAITKHKTTQDWYEEVSNPDNRLLYDGLFISIGMSDKELDKAEEIVNISNNFVNTPVKICIDVANGYMNNLYSFIEKVRTRIPQAFIIAGTVVTPEACVRIIESGADLARVGIGTGAVCTTRRMTGVGYPQFSALAECVPAANEIGGGIVSDGGCVHPGDFSKAFAIGAKMVMAGSIFAGHDESEQEVHNGHITFYGMSSRVAQETHGNYQRYRASEGRVVQIPYKGLVEHTVQEILGGIRSTCAYVNAPTLLDLPKNASFIRVNNQLNKSLERYTLA